MIFWMWFPSDRVVLGCVKRLLRRVMKWMTPLRHDPTNKKHRIRHKTHSNTFVLEGLPILQLLYWRSYRRNLPCQPVPATKMPLFLLVHLWRQATNKKILTGSPLLIPSRRFDNPAQKQRSKPIRVCSSFRVYAQRYLHARAPHSHTHRIRDRRQKTLTSGTNSGLIRAGTRTRQ